MTDPFNAGWVLSLYIHLISDRETDMMLSIGFRQFLYQEVLLCLQERVPTIAYLELITDCFRSSVLNSNKLFGILRPASLGDQLDLFHEYLAFFPTLKYRIHWGCALFFENELNILDLSFFGYYLRFAGAS